ncbi:hypothetical protein [Pseudomonas sp. LB3P25]
MNNPAPGTNTNLVANGDFKQGYDDWEDVTNPDGVDIGEDDWGEERLRYVSLKNQASVCQVIEVPGDDDPDARYHLTFLYETLHLLPGKVLVAKEGSEQEIEIELPPRREPQDSSAPLLLDLIELEQYLDLDLQAGDQLRITLISPKNEPNDRVSKVILTRIELHLELTPLQLAQVVNDGQRFSPEQTLYLCIGAMGDARHALHFEPLQGSPWAGLPAALWSNDNPQQAINTLPALGENQPFNLPWFADCPVLQGDAPFLFTLSIYSKYTAAPYLLSVSLGHHRLKLNVLKGAAFWPVLGQTVPLEVQVLSHYTGKPVSGVEVTWRLGVDVLHSGPSDGEGKAGFDYTPDSDGLQTIEVSVPSPYYEALTERESLEIRVLKDDPLKTVQVRFEGGEAAVWGEKTGYPDRGSSYSFSVILPEGSPLLGDQIAVRWGEGGYLPEDLDITSMPDFGCLINAESNELEWTLDCGDRLDARFGLFLSNPRLLRGSRDNAMSLARNNYKIGDWREANKSPMVDEGDSVHCMLQLLTPNDQPALDVSVDWVTPRGTVTTQTGIGGWASVIDKPTEAGSYEIVAKVQSRIGAAPLEHRFAIVARENSGWKNEIDFSLDTKIIDRGKWGIICRRGATHTLRIDPKTQDSPFIGHSITLKWQGGVDPELGLVFDPPLGGTHTLTKAGLEWKVISGRDRSGLFELEIGSSYLQEARELSGRLIGLNVEDEATLVFDQMPSAFGEKTLYPCLGSVHVLSVLPHAFSPLQGLELEWALDDPHPPGLVISPGNGESQVITAGGVQWELDCRGVQEPAVYGLYLHGTDIVQTDQRIELKVDHNKLKIGAVRPAAVDPVLSKGERARLEVQYLSWFSDLPAAGMAVSWSEAAGPLPSSVTDAGGWAGLDYEPGSAGLISVVAQRINPYDASVADQSFDVNVLATDPWLDLKVKTEDTNGDWGTSTFFPRRNREFNLTLSANEGTYLHGRSVALGLTGTGPEALTLAFEPVALGAYRSFANGLPITFKSGGVGDGGCSFRLAASRLLALSPPNAVSLGAGSRAIKLSAITSRLQVIDWGSVFEARVTVVSVFSGKPVVGVPIVWSGSDLEPVSMQTNFYGVATVRFTPTIAGLGQLTATAGDDQASDSLSLSYTVNAPRQILEIGGPDLIGYPGEEVSAYAIVVSGHTGKALEGVAVDWRFKGVSLEPTVTDVDGKASIRFKLPDGVGERALIASVGGGVIGREAARLVFELSPGEPVISSLTCNRPVTYTGYEVNARVTVMGASTGKPMEGVKIKWSFAGNPLPDSVTNTAGVASVNFVTSGVGEYELVASLDSGLPGSKTQTIKVNAPKESVLAGIYALPAIIQMGRSSVISVRVVGVPIPTPQSGRRVDWTINGQPLPSTYSNDEGWTNFEYRGTGPGDMKFEGVLKNQSSTAKTSLVLKVIASL